jgi:uncharacterized RmlC-like cupin family protein
MTQPSGGAGAALSHSPASTHRETDPTPGMVRRVAVDTGSMWTGTAVTEPGMVSGWHHHGDHDSSIYVADGVLHMEYGPGGSGSFDAVAGDVVHVPAGAVHRESNPADEPSLLVVVRCGSGAPTVNVDGPAPA